MRAVVDGWRLPQNWQETGWVYNGLTHDKIATRPMTAWNGNPYCDPGAVLYLPGYPGTGATIRDFSGQGNHGTITDAQWRRLASGLWYLYFDGTDDNVNVGTGASLNISNNLTIACWFNADNIVGTKALVAKMTNAVGANVYNLSISDDNIRFFKGQPPLGGAENNIFAAGFTAGVWVFVALTMADKAVNCYMGYNGVFSTLAPWTAAVSGSDSNAAIATVIGERTDGASDFGGGIALPRIFGTTVKTATQLHAMYHQERHLGGV